MRLAGMMTRLNPGSEANQLQVEGTEVDRTRCTETTLRQEDRSID